MREFIVVSQRSAPVPMGIKDQATQPELAGSLFRADHTTCRSIHGGRTLVIFRYLTRPPSSDPDRFFDGIAVTGKRLVRDEKIPLQPAQ